MLVSSLRNIFCKMLYTCRKKKSFYFSISIIRKTLVEQHYYQTNFLENPTTNFVV